MVAQRRLSPSLHLSSPSTLSLSLLPPAGPPLRLFLAFVGEGGVDRLGRTPLCVRVCLARRKMSPISFSPSLSRSLVACIGSVVCPAHLLSLSLSLSRHSFHKFIAQQIACEVSDAQEQKEATDPQRPAARPPLRWTPSLSVPSGRQTTRQIDLKYCITHAPKPQPYRQTSNFTMVARWATLPTCTLDGDRVAGRECRLKFKCGPISSIRILLFSTLPIHVL